MNQFISSCSRKEKKNTWYFNRFPFFVIFNFLHFWTFVSPLPIFVDGKKMKISRKMICLLSITYKIGNNFYLWMSVFIVCHWRVFYQVFQTISLGRNFLELLQREISKTHLECVRLLPFESENVKQEMETCIFCKNHPHPNGLLPWKLSLKITLNAWIDFYLL